MFILAFVRALLLLLALAGCVRSDSTVCAGGKVCSNDQICVHATDAVTVCADPGQRAACEGAGVADGETCGDAGRCYDGTCLPVTCGDQLVDPGLEQCDDGNNTPGDDCSADCRSNETCGNGVVDPIEQEVCDDGNLVGHDGCSDACTPEAPRWREIEFGPPRAGRPVGMAYLPSRGRVVALVDDLAGNTWEWNGAGWQRIVTTVAPANRQDFAVAADPVRDVLVVIGGSSGGTASLPDLWELDNDRWSLVTATLRPRTAAAAVYDPRRSRVLVFGGRDDGGIPPFVHEDMFEWDGTTATPVAQSTPWPAARWGAAMVYDPRRDEVVLYGGRDNTNIFDDTWTLNGSTWTRHVVQGPGALIDARMFVDATGVVLFGGSDGAAGLADGWRWDGAQWTAIGQQGPGRRIAPGVAYDTARGRAVLFGGNATDSSTWEWTGNKWAPFQTLPPPIGEFLAVTFDPLRHQGLVVSGAATLTMRDGSWSALGPGPIPARSTSSMVFDIARDRAVMFGGVASGGTILAETLVLSPGSANPMWASAGTATSPTARSSAAMAYDSGRNVTVLFGGNDGLTAIDDTWELDTDWQLRTPATKPPPRSSAMIAYDPVRKKTLLFGGNDFASQPLGDTWEWNGTAWTELHPVGRTPPARSDGTLTWNPGRRRLTLISGRASFLGIIDDAWEWTGDAWAEIKPLTTPGARAAHIAVPASDASGLYVIGGGNLSGVLGDQWLLTWSDTGRNYERCVAHHDRDGDELDGCADPDCWWTCTPLCIPTLPCAPAAPRCGDGAAAPGETCQLCPADVTACPFCGDRACETAESATSCPGDCL